MHPQGFSLWRQLSDDTERSLLLKEKFVTVFKRREQATPYRATVPTSGLVRKQRQDHQGKLGLVLLLCFLWEWQAGQGNSLGLALE